MPSSVPLPIERKYKWDPNNLNNLTHTTKLNGEQNVA